MGTTTLATIDQRLSEAIDDFIELDTTTNLSTNNYIVATGLNEYDDGSDDAFNNWWV